jgi:hypothetical protein
LFFRRGSRTDDPWLTEKLWLFTLGAVGALLGMLLDNGWVMALGGVALAGGLILRLVPRGSAGAPVEQGADPDPDPDPDPDSDRGRG